MWRVHQDAETQSMESTGMLQAGNPRAFPSSTLPKPFRPGCHPRRALSCQLLCRNAHSILCFGHRYLGWLRWERSILVWYGFLQFGYLLYAPMLCCCCCHRNMTFVKWTYSLYLNNRWMIAGKANECQLVNLVIDEQGKKEPDCSEL